MKFKFQSHAAQKITEIEAETEQEARTKAMEEFWGPPQGIYKQGYLGTGLFLLKQE